MEPYISQHPKHGELVLNLRKNRNCELLDLGCGFGQNIYHLINLGVHPEQLYGLDIDERFVDLGKQLYATKFQSHRAPKFLFANILDMESDSLTKLRGKFDYVYAAAFFHLFDEKQQYTAFKQAIQLLKPQAGSAILGTQAGSNVSKLKTHMPVIGEKMFIHNPQSLGNMIRKVSAETGLKLVVEAKVKYSAEYELFAKSYSNYDGDGGSKIVFSITRLD